MKILKIEHFQQFNFEKNSEKQKVSVLNCPGRMKRTKWRAWRMKGTKWNYHKEESFTSNCFMFSKN